MSTVILFITLVAIIAVFAVLFACYQSQARAREQRVAAQVGDDLGLGLLYTWLGWLDYICQRISTA